VGAYLVSPNCHSASALRFREIAAQIPKFPRSLQETPLPLLSFFGGCRGIDKLINLLASQFERLRRRFGASLPRRLRAG